MFLQPYHGSLVLITFISLHVVPVTAQASETKLPSAEGVTETQKEKLKQREKLAKEANALRSTGKMKEAIAKLEQVLAIEREVFGESDAELLGTLNSLDGLHLARRDFAAARSIRDQIILTTVKLYGTQHWKSEDARFALKELSILSQFTESQWQRQSQAKQLYRRSLRQYREGNYAAAVQSMVHSVEIRKRLYASDHL